MTPPPVVPAREWWTRPRIMFPVIGALFALVALLTPESPVGASDTRLSAHLSGVMGARGLKEIAAKLGWRVVLRDSQPVPRTPPGTTVHAVLDVALPITAAQAHRYLEAVRGGDALLFVVGERSPLGDSLGVRHARAGGELVTPAADTAGCAARDDGFVPEIFTTGVVRLYPLRWPRGRPAGAETFTQVRLDVDDEEAADSTARTDSARADSVVRGVRADSAAPVVAIESLPRPSVTAAARAEARRRSRRADKAYVIQESVAGFPLGRGRVVVVADPDLLRNDVLRRCGWGADMQAVRALEWLRAGGAAPRTTLEFDEYHQGFGPVPSVIDVTLRFLRTHPVGRTILNLALAGLVLLLALAPRAVPPRLRGRTERRDPLEQVSALANAYRQVGATRTATLRLLSAVRARVERAGGTGRLRDDDAFLAQAAALDPERAADVALVRGALVPGARGVSLPDVGAALHRIEVTFTITPSHRA